jgi:hypothetical protein
LLLVEVLVEVPLVETKAAVAAEQVVILLVL